jgi:hypothetical protein
MLSYEACDHLLAATETLLNHCLSDIEVFPGRLRLPAIVSPDQPRGHC